VIRVRGDRVIVALPPALDELVSDGGLVLPQDPDKARTPTRGLVMALGERVKDVALGDCVVFTAWAGDALEHNGVDYVILHESEIIGVLEPSEATA
jgi:chaperonin GroES